MSKISDNISDFFRRTDIVLWLLTLAAVIYSLLLISSMQRSGTYSYLRSQLVAVGLGLLLAVVIAVADFRFLIKRWYLAALLAAALAALVFVFGIRVSGTDDTAWIAIPGGFRFQPSEIIKICFIITFSAHLSYLSEKDRIKHPIAVMSLLLHALVPMTIIHIQGDDGTVLIFGMIFLIMCFVAGVQLRYFAVLGGALLIGIPLIWNLFLNDEHRNRFLALFDLDGNAMTNYGWQQYQSKVSIRQSITINDSKGQFKYFGFYKALFDFLVAPPPIAPSLIFLGQDMQTGRYQVAFRFDDGNEKKIWLTPREYDAYFQVALRSYKGRTKGLPISCDKHIKPTIAHIKGKISDEIPDLTYSDQYKPERNGNVYVIRLDQSKVFVRVHTHNCGCEYEEIPIVKYDKK